MGVLRGESNDNADDDQWISAFSAVPYNMRAGRPGCIVSGLSAGSP